MPSTNFNRKKDAHIIQLNRETYNAPKLKILSDKNISKIFIMQEQSLFIKILRNKCENVHCKLMSKLAEVSDKHGLKDLIKEFLGTDISKNLQSSDFGGNLSDKQLEYCAKDVIYLHEIFNNLKNILIREKRFNLYESTIKFIHNRVDLDLASFNYDIWSH